ncbi:head maturation protease, ClpP-related [Xanthobacter flavus]|uniref:head maturation protease, ClpP-related n=1 Tax=Xanthobacter flavus TaxID=281 RepID=UPI001AE5335F|nr:head maturation protease, ClpP-related [Xanthobacter flavus]MBP2147937.1 ATP-dependent protease ClpP protease subunit [Xanthobacter flavus]
MARDLIVDGELVLYGPVGGDWWDDSGFTAMDVIQSLAQMDGDITVRLNSGGGVAWDGVAIYNALKAYSGAVTVVVEGVAASAASIIAMAGDDVEMRAGALMMIHNASTITWGTAEDHEKSRELLAKLDGQLAAIYAERTGLDLAEIRALMDAETWMDAAEAIDKGFAGAADDEKAAKASAFDYRLYAKAPKALQSQSKKLKAPAAAQPWGVPMNTAAPAAAPRKPAKITPSAAPAAKPEASMPETKAAPEAANDNAKAVAEATKAATARIGGILNHAEAAGREALAKHLAFETELDVEAAAKLLATAEKGGEPTPQQEECPAAHADRRAKASGLTAPVAGDTKPKGKGDLSILASCVAKANKRR